MNQGFVTLEDVLGAATARAASIVSETSGYLTLALGDAMARAPFSIDEKAIMLSTEGAVTNTKRGCACSPGKAAEGLRSMLARLLAVGTGSAMPSLTAAARPRDESDRGVDGVVQEIEAALIPVNRAAARRALARLARETLKAKDAGRIVKPAPPPRRAAAPAKAPSAAPVADAAPPVPVAPVVATVTPAVAMPPAPSPAIAPEAHDAPTAFVLATPLPSIVSASVVTPPAPAPPELVAPAQDPVRIAPTAKPPPVVLAPIPQPIPQPIATPIAEPAAPLATSPAALDASVRRLALELPTLPLVSMLTPAPAAVRAIEEPMRDRTPTLLGIAPVDVFVEANTRVDAEVSIDLTPSDAMLHDVPPSPTGLAAVLALPTEDPRSAFELDEAPRALPIAAAFDIVVAHDPVPCAPLMPNAKPTRADDLLARFGASCVDDQAMLATAARLRRMAGLDATPPPMHAEAHEAAASTHEPSPMPPPETADGALIDELSPLPAPVPRRRASRSKGTAALAMVATLALGGLGALALVRFQPDVLLYVSRARDVIARSLSQVSPQRAAPPGAPTPSAAASAAATATASPTPTPVERGFPARAERGTTQRQR